MRLTGCRKSTSHWGDETKEGKPYLNSLMFRTLLVVRPLLLRWCVDKQITETVCLPSVSAWFLSRPLTLVLISHVCFLRMSMYVVYAEGCGKGAVRVSTVSALTK